MQKFYKAFSLLMLFSSMVWSQDAIIIKEGDFLRGLIKGTDFNQVAFEVKENQVKLYHAKDIEGFVWNGETFLSKPLLVDNKMTTRFYRAVESGKINLYTTGMKVEQEQIVERPRSKPRIGIGIGTGGMGSGVSIGTGGMNNRPVEKIPAPADSKIRFFIEKPGTGPLLELNFDFPASVKAQLGLKIQDNKELFEAIKGLQVLTPEQVILVIQKYNEAP